jgi:hypothetical protein
MMRWNTYDARPGSFKRFRAEQRDSPVEGLQR